MTPFEVPQFNRDFRRYSDEESLAFAYRTGWLDDIGVFDSTHGLVQAASTPWWPKCQLITMQNNVWGDVLGAWILDGATDNLIRLDGTSPPIHNLNRKHGTNLKTEHVLQYLGFFCTFVQASEGMFGLVESGREAILPIDWPRDDLIKLLKPVTLLSEDERGFRVEATVCFGDALFWVHFLVQRSGICDMIEDEPLATNLNSRIAVQLKFDDKQQAENESEEKTMQ